MATANMGHISHAARISRRDLLAAKRDPYGFNKRLMDAAREIVHSASTGVDDVNVCYEWLLDLKLDDHGRTVCILIREWIELCERMSVTR